MMNVREHNPAWAGYITLTGRRSVHVKSLTGGYDKVILTWRYECENCDYQVTKDGLSALDKVALKHVRTAHDLRPWHLADHAL